MEDRRLRRTRERLRESLLELLGEKDIRAVTVKELTDRADVNRGTFYSHYQDIYDMLDQLEAEVFGEFTALLDAYTQADLERGLEPILRDVFCFVDRHAGLCLRLMAGVQENAFFQRLRQEIHRRAMEDWGELYGFAAAPDGERQLAFVVSGAIGMVQSWLTDGRKESPEDMAALAGLLILHGIQPRRER